MASEQLLSTVKGAKVLMVGAGGVGCELLKSLALSGFQDIHIIDFDTIEVSNLNRQFLFRQSHVGQSKARVARDAVLKFRPHIDIISHHANVKDPTFDVDFFKQFDVVLNALDCMSARRHVNRLCLAAGVPLIESGTGGLLGQVFVHVKGKTECFECQPKPAPKTYPVCTITSTPSKFVHCVVWAKDLLFAKLFGDKNQENDLNLRAPDAVADAGSSAKVEDIIARKDNEEIEQYVRRIYDQVFGHSIEVALSNEERWKNRIKPKPMYCRDFVSDDHQKEIVNTNGAGSEMSSSSASASLGLKTWQEVWSIEENSKIFLLAMKLFFEKREKEIGRLAFDKDDQLAVEFVTSAANIRAACFGIPMMSLFEAKGIAGNIVHAVATTNAIVAGLMVIEAVKVLQNDSDNYRTTYCIEYPVREMLLMPVEPSEPNKLCYVCSMSPLMLEVNTSRTKLRDFVDKIVKATLGMNLPIIMLGSILLYEVGDDLEEDMVASYEANLEKVLCELPSAVTGGTILTVEDLQQELCCHIYIKQREDFDDEKEPDGMVLSGWTQTPPTDKEKVKATAENDHEDASMSTNFAPSACKQGIIPVTDKTEYSAVLPSYLGSHPYGDRKEVTVIVGDDDDDLIVLPDGDCWKS